MRMEVSLLNSGSAGNCCIIRSEHTTLMIDCGAPTQKYLKKAMAEVSVSVSDLDGVLITHSHSDHIRWLNMVRQVPVYSYCPLVCRNSKKQELPINHHLIVPDEIFEINDFIVQTLGLSHDAGNTLGFVITQKTTGERLVYVTDTGYFPMSYQEDIRGADYYIFESNHDPEMLMKTSRPLYTKQRILSDLGHLNNQDAAALLASSVTGHTKKIVLAHISREANTENLALGALESALASKGYCLQDFDAEAAGQFDITDFRSEDFQPAASSETGSALPAASQKEQSADAATPDSSAEDSENESRKPEKSEEGEKAAGFSVLSMPEPKVTTASARILKDQESFREDQAKKRDSFFGSIEEIFS